MESVETAYGFFCSPLLTKGFSGGFLGAFLALCLCVCVEKGDEYGLAD